MSFEYETYGLRIVKDVPVRCNRCGNHFFISTEDIDYETHCVDEPMGTRVNYTFYSECSCPRCEQDIYFQQHASEYPAGAVDGVFNPECAGGTILAYPEVEIPYDDEELYVSDDPIYSTRLASKPIVLDGKLNIDVVDGDAFIGNQLYIPNNRTTI